MNTYPKPNKVAPRSRGPVNSAPDKFARLRAVVQEKVPISDEDLARFPSFFVPRRVRKRQCLLNAGEVCRSVAFVSQRCLRSYIIDDDGADRVLRFAIEGGWICDLGSFRTGKPAICTVDALENSEVLLINRASVDSLYRTMPIAEHFLRLILEELYGAAIIRVSDFVSLSARERYLHFAQMYPELVQRVPLGQIASCLGITAQTLSRIRREIAQKR
jgi:CRP-like cAMP-binding protein